MKFACGILGTLGGCLVMVGCGNSGDKTVAGNPSGTGPFDSRGYYVEAWADSPEKWNRGGSKPAPVTPVTQPAPPPVIASTDLPPPDSVPVVVAAHNPTPRPAAPRPAATTPVRVTPKPVAAKPKPAAPTRYVIKRGDTLYGIALKNKTTVAALQRTNGIKGSIIHPGKTLVIPR